MPNTLSLENKKIVTRFAPSPTGYMHVGGARTALYAWAFARKNNGTFILRIEDTDRERAVEGSIEHIIASLKWIGLDWDEGVDIGGPNAPYKQSERLDSYKKYAQILVDKGLAYADPYSTEELEAFRKLAEEEKRPFLYRDHRPENPPVWDGTKALRFKTPEIKSYEWDDLVRGKLSAGEEALDDFILIKSDGYPTYNFAHIIDDLEMGVTHIFRADEFISSTPKFLSVYDALEIDRPLFVTLPPIMGSDGKKKLGKRDGAKDILDYKKEGYLPEAMMNFLAFIGWNPGDDREIFTPEDFIKNFSIEGIQTAGGKLNEDKLNWFNKEHLKLLSDEKFAELAFDYIPESIKKTENFTEKFIKIIPLIRERISYFGELMSGEKSEEIEIFFKTPSYSADILLCSERQRKGLNINLKSLVPILNKLNSLIDNVTDNSETTMDDYKNAIWDYAEEQGRGVVLWALRVALSGKERSPDPFTLCLLLGKKESQKRIKDAINNIQTIDA